MPGHLYASLIGVNAYEQVNALRGCIRDIMRIDSWLLEYCKQEQIEYQPALFLAPHAPEKPALESYLTSTHQSANYHEPSFEMLTTKAFQHFANAKADDVCLFYFSGHGSYVKAPPSLSNSGGLQQLETLMPVDARTTGRPILDKELAYLLYKTFHEKAGVHCVVIMDCCHSGNNTREAVKLDELSYRQAEPDTNEPLAFENWLGYKEGFYTLKNEKLVYPLARYVHIAACRNHQKAADHPLGGMFSRALANALANYTIQPTYRELIQQVAVDIAIANGQQNPVTFAFHDEDLDQVFLGGKSKAPTKAFRINWLGDEKGWCLMAGELQGIVASTKIKILVGKKNIEATVNEVGINHSTLQAKSWAALDCEQSYSATILQVATAKKTIAFHPALKKQKALCQKISEAVEEVKPLFYSLQQKTTNPDYWMALVPGDKFVLVNAQSEVPLFEATSDAAVFVKHADAVCRWHQMLTIKPTTQYFIATDFELDVAIITGKKITGDTLNNEKGDLVNVTFGETIEMPYRQGFQPALRLSINIKSSASFNNCFVQALHFDNQFGIHTQYIPADEAALQKGGKISLSFPIQQHRFDAIPIGLGKNRALLQLKEAIHIIRIIVSTATAIDVGHYAQPSLAQSLGEKLLNQPDGPRRDVASGDGWSSFDIYLDVTA